LPSSYNIEDSGAKSLLTKTSGSEMMWVTVMLMVSADGIKLPPYVILSQKTVPKE
jgi:hypothetical protein